LILEAYADNLHLIYFLLLNNQIGSSVTDFFEKDLKILDNAVFTGVKTVFILIFWNIKYSFYDKL